MRYLFDLTLAALLLVGLELLSGCNGRPAASVNPVSPQTKADDKAEPAKLSAEDRKLAEK